MTLNFQSKLKVTVAIPLFLLLLLATSFGETSQNARYRRLKQLPVGVESYVQAKNLVLKLIRARPERALEYFVTGVSKIRNVSVSVNMVKPASRIVLRSNLTLNEKRRITLGFVRRTTPPHPGPPPTPAAVSPTPSPSPDAL